jgi:multidrug transporter EmrE-like cation transporter
MDLTHILATAVVTEATTEAFKNILQKSNTEIKALYVQLFSVVVGILLAFTLQMDITYAINGQIDFVGILVTGVLVSRGANYIHDMLNVLNTYIKVIKKEGN